jgi:hypothetical protein
MSVGGDDDRGGGNRGEAKKAKRARLADEEWDRAVLTKPEWGGHKNTCVEFKKYVGGLGGVGNGYKPLATRYSKKEKPLSMFSQQYRMFMSKLFEVLACRAPSILPAALDGLLLVRILKLSDVRRRRRR